MGSSTQLAVPTAAPTGAGGSNAGFQMSAADVWRVIRANLWLILLFVVLGAVGGYYGNEYLARHYSKYTATGIVRIMPLQSMDLAHPNSGMDNQTLAIEQKTEARIIQSDGLFYSVLNDSASPIRDTNWWKVTCNGEPSKARRDLTEKLTAQPLLDSSLINVSMTASDPADTKTIVLTVVNEAITIKQKSIRAKNQAESSRLTDAKNNVDRELREVTKEAKEKASKLNLNGMATVGPGNSKDLELNKRVEAMLAMQSNANNAESAYNSFIESLKRGDTPPMVEEHVNQDTNIVQLRNMVDNLDLKLADMQAGKLGTNNPSVKSLQQSRDVYQQRYEDSKSQKTAQMVDLLKVELAAQKENTAKQYKQIEDSVMAVKKDLADLNSGMTEYMALKEKEVILRKQSDEYKSALDNMEQMLRAADFNSLDWAQQP